MSWQFPLLGGLNSKGLRPLAALLVFHCLAAAEVGTDRTLLTLPGHFLKSQEKVATPKATTWNAEPCPSFFLSLNPLNSFCNHCHRAGSCGSNYKCSFVSSKTSPSHKVHSCVYYIHSELFEQGGSLCESHLSMFLQAELTSHFRFIVAISQSQVVS